MAGPEVSHGRGGAGNINPDDTKYVDGEVVRAGATGSHGDGAFSTGRGGKAFLSRSASLLSSSTNPLADNDERQRGTSKESEWCDINHPSAGLSQPTITLSPAKPS